MFPETRVVETVGSLTESGYSREYMSGFKNAYKTDAVKKEVENER